MTISSGDLQILLLNSPAASLDGQMAAPPLHVRPAIEGLAAEDMVEMDFWQLVSQNFPQQEIENILQNNDLVDLPDTVSFLIQGPEQAPSETLQVVDIGAVQWLRTLKSHFATGAEQQPDTEHNEAIAPTSSIVVPLFGAVNAEPINTVPQSVNPVTTFEESGNGQILPLQRQTLARGVEGAPPVLDLKAVDEKAINVKTVDVKTGHVKAAEAIDARMPARDNEIEAELGHLPERQERQSKGPSLVEIQTPSAARPAGPEPAPANPSPVATLSVAGPGLNPSAPATTAAAAQAQPLHIANPASPNQWGEAIGERVALLINHRSSSAELRLDPPHLGKLDIQIQVQDDRAVIHITTQHAQTRDMIDNAGVRLREFLQESGYSSVDVNVSHREQSMAGEDGRQQADSTSMEDAGRLDRAASGDEMRMDASLLADYLPSRGVIDFFA